MRSWLALLALVPSVSIAGAQIRLWELVEGQSKTAAPASIQAVLANAERSRLADCISERTYHEDVLRTYFAAVPLPLAKASSTYLVYPSSPCTEFFGAHSVEFWLVEDHPDGNISILFNGRQDGLSVLRTSTRGHRDISLHYGSEESALRFNGQRYVVVPE